MSLGAKRKWGSGDASSSQPVYQPRPNLKPRSWSVDPISMSSTEIQPAMVSLNHPELVSPILLHRVWLRDSCTCDRCVDPASGQKTFATCDIPDNPPIQSLQRLPDGCLEVTWRDDFLTHDFHVSQYSDARVDELFNIKTPPLMYRQLWGADLATVNGDHEYDGFMSDGAGYLSAMAALQTYGLIVLRGVPSSETAVEDIASRLGILQETFYGRTWDVISKPEAENVAYTNSYLGLHQDLLYMPQVPRLQLLHCLENSCEGGESLFSDGARVDKQIRHYFPTAARRLRSRWIRYHYHKNGHSYSKQRPMISDTSDEYVFWSPPFQSSRQFIDKDSDGVRSYQNWLYATRVMKNLIEYDKYVYQRKLSPGECVVFDNIRVLHGRRQFDTSSGKRWLKGAYVEEGSYKSKWASVRDSVDPPVGIVNSLHKQVKDSWYPEEDIELGIFTMHY
ncbi:Clavaminate synthase-like protein [Xylariomycetidae sp. FL2044]|nr:Clavaminate synthase-like protein [Xylariomycetidae sp. FL2044]